MTANVPDPGITTQREEPDSTRGYCVGCGQYTSGTFVAVLNSSSDSVRGYECYPAAPIRTTAGQRTSESSVT
jgi:hypothetical protein